MVDSDAFTQCYYSRETNEAKDQDNLAESLTRRLPYLQTETCSRPPSSELSDI